MATRLSTWAAAAYLATVGPSLAFAQQAEQSTRQQQPSWDWPCPWHMWNAGWGFWWIFPLLMLLMIVFCAGIFFLGHRSSSGNAHHSTDAASPGLRILCMPHAP